MGISPPIVQLPAVGEPGDRLRRVDLEDDIGILVPLGGEHRTHIARMMRGGGDILRFHHIGHVPITLQLGASTIDSVCSPAPT